MPALASDPATPETTLCGRCGSTLVTARAGAITCQDCLGSDLAADLANWFAAVVPPSHGLRAAGEFVLMEEIGHGGMGQVFRARQESPDREVAVKLLMPHLSGSEETRRRFLAEAEAMAELEHPGLLPLYACGETDGRPWLVTRLAVGGNLTQRRQRFAGRWRDIAELIARLADAIQHAHARGIIHRDLKPSNVLFDSEDAACVADFGLAKWRDENSASQTLTHAVMGTPSYMAPELAKNGARAATTAADVYGLGAILYELLTGRPPHVGRSPAEIFVSLANSDPPPPRSLQQDIPRDLDVICLRALAREPAGRYETAAALAADLRSFLAGETVSARPYSLPERAVRWARRRPLAAALTGALAAVMAVSAVVIVKKNSDWRAAADDAEAQVAVVVDFLPEKLAPLGNLKALDSIFEEIAKHYRRARSGPDPQIAEGREAHFLVKWAQILRRQGRIEEAEKRLDEGTSIAERLTAQRGAPAEAWAALAHARRLSGLLKLGKGQMEEAEGLLGDAVATADAGLKIHSSATELLIARAASITERCSALIAGEGGEPATLDELESAWRGVVARTAASPVHQDHLRELAKVHYYRGDAAAKRGKWREAETHFRALLAEHELLSKFPAADDQDRRNIALACSRIANAMHADMGKDSRDAERLSEMRALHDRQHSTMDDLMSRDPTNLRWKADAAVMLVAEAAPSSLADDYDKALHLLHQAADLIREIPNEVSTDLEKQRPVVLYSRAQAMWRYAGALSRKAGTAADREAACDAAESAFAAAVEAWPFRISGTVSPKTIIDYSIGILNKNGEPGRAREFLECAADQHSSDPGLTALFRLHLNKLQTGEPAPNHPKTPAP
jgi:serine/threonine protein kinase